MLDDLESEETSNPNNAALQFVDEEEDGWDDDDFDLSEDLQPPPSPESPAPAVAPASPGVRQAAPLSADVDALNDPDLVHLGPAPIVGGAGFRGASSDLFGEQASNVMGRATSPKLYAQVSQFPTCTQLRVWKWENGIPVGLGTIDATATEEDFVRQFFAAMPKKGEGKCQYKMRPIDIRGQELGQEATLVISEHHSTLGALRVAEEDERAGRNPMMGLFGRGFGAERGGGSGSDEMARELTGMVEHMLATSDQRTRHLEEALESERDRMRQEELERTRERVDLATNAAQGVQAVTERLMQDESQRSERAMRSQEQQSNMLVTTLSTVFAQQQSAMQQQAAEQRRSDEFRLQQERQRAEEERRSYHDRIKMEREEAERKRQLERDEMESRIRREREEADRRFKMETLRMEREREDRKMEMERAKDEARLRHDREKAEGQMKVQQDRDRIERERREHDLKLQREREDIERRMRTETERMERDRQERREQMEREKGDRDEKARREREDAKLRDQERQRQHDRLLEDAKLSAQQQREHAERMLQMQKMEMEKKTSFGGLETLAQFGLNPKDILPRMFGTGGPEGEGEDGEEGGSWADSLPKILGVAADMMRGRADPAQQAVAAQQAAQQQAATRRPTPAPRRLPPPTPDFQQQQFNEAFEATAQEVVSPPPSQESGEPASRQSAKVTPGRARAAIPPNLKNQAKEAGMKLKGIRGARKGLQRLVRQVAVAPAEKWEELITAGIFSAPVIYNYVSAVTVKAAIDEAGAEESLRDAVIVAMKKSNLVPDDLPYGDE